MVRIVNLKGVALEGFAILGGRGREETESAARPFGGILVESSENVRIARNLISGNSSVLAGGGIACINVDSTVVIAHNLITGNSTERPKIGSTPGGGGLYLGQGAKAQVHHNTIIYNEAVGEGGGILCEAASPHLRNNIIAYNQRGGIAFRPLEGIASEQAGSGPTLSYNDVWSNSTYDYSGLEPGFGDFSSDPKFRAPGKGDFRLARNTPCRDASSSGDVGVTPPGRLEKATPPRERVERFGRVVPEDSPVVRKVNFLSLILPAARELQVDTVQTEIYPLDLELLSYSTRLFDRSSGLPSNQVNVVELAPDGSVWVGMDQGVGCYDGLWTFLDTLHGLPSNEVLEILAMEDAVWIATREGLVRYRNDQAQVVSSEVFHELRSDPLGGIWLQGERDAHLDTVWTYFSFADSAGLAFHAFPRLVDDSGAVWWWLNRPGGSLPTVARYLPSQLEAYRLPSLNLVIEEWQGFQSMQSGEDGLWIGFHESQRVETQWYTLAATSIGQLDTTRPSLQVYSLPKEWGIQNYYTLVRDRKEALWAFGGNTVLRYDGERWSGTKEVEFASPAVELDSAGSFWFAQPGRGVIRYGTPTWTTFEGEARLEGKRVTCLAEDPGGNIWFGTNEGLSRRNQDGSWTQLSVTDTLVTDLLVDRRGELWVATAQGVYRFDDGAWADLREGLPDTVATVLAEGGDGRIWAGTGSGLFRYEGPGWQRVPMSPWRLQSWKDPNAIQDLYVDAEGRMWVGTAGGLYRLESESVKDYFEVFYAERRVDLDSLLVLEQREEIWSGLREMLREEVDLAWFLAKGDAHLGGSADKAWQRLNRAYVYLVQENEDFSRLERQTVENGYVDLSASGASELEPEWQALRALGSERVFDIFADTEGTLWFATYGGLFTRKNGQWMLYKGSDRPFAGELRDAVVDSRGNMWLATTKGAVCYDGAHWVVFDAEDGLVDDEVVGILEDRDGDIWFATAKGVNRYRPDNRPPQTRVVRAPEGKVGYGTSLLNFEFEGGDREWEEGKLSFSYALTESENEPGETDWSAWGEETFVQMPPPGDGLYIFHVRARDKVLNVDSTPATHVLNLAPPWWKEPIFQVVAGFGLVLVVFSSSYAMRKRRQARRAEQALMQDLEEELQTAHDLQQGLMPTESPQIEGFGIAGRCLPANHVGGDFFQYFPQNDKLSICLADVTGHAMEAAQPSGSGICPSLKLPAAAFRL